jgi:phosphoribosylformimino-5-aminoimidazole carboxamide ribotide isomerase
VDLFPAIDIRHGRVVRLSQGEATRQTVYGDDPAAVAAGFVEQGAAWIHVVDLDRAFGDGENLDTVRRIVDRVAGRARVQLGGGLRTLERIDEALAHGAGRLVIGTAAALDPGFVPSAVSAAGSERLAVGLDTRGGLVAVRGWTETSALTAEALARRVIEQGITTLVYTDVSRDGMLRGPDLAGAQALQPTGAGVIASGGIAELSHLLAAREAGLAGAIVGRALYEGRFSVAEALEAAGGAPRPG